MKDTNDLSIEDMRHYILKSYPTGYLRGKNLYLMSYGQVLAIYNSIKKRKYSKSKRKKTKQIKGQMSLFDKERKHNETKYYI